MLSLYGNVLCVLSLVSRLFAVCSDSCSGVGTPTRINPTELPVMKPPGRFLPHRGGEEVRERDKYSEEEREALRWVYICQAVIWH